MHRHFEADTSHLPNGEGHEREFDDAQKQWLQGFVSGIEARKAADKLASRTAGVPSGGGGQPIGPDALQHAAQDRTVALGRQAGRRGNRQARAPSARSLGRGGGARRGGAVPQGHRRLPHQVSRALLRRAGREFLHVPAAHSQRHPECLADARPGRCRGCLRRRLCRCDDARQPADSRDPGAGMRSTCCSPCRISG